MANSTNSNRQTLAAPDIADYLGISRSGAYNLLHAVDFPSFRIGGRVLVTQKAFEQWLEKQEARDAQEKKQERRY